MNNKIRLIMLTALLGFVAGAGLSSGYAAPIVIVCGLTIWALWLLG